jgi:hypothetical protein
MVDCADSCPCTNGNLFRDDIPIAHRDIETPRMSEWRLLDKCGRVFEALVFRSATDHDCRAVVDCIVMFSGDTSREKRKRCGICRKKFAEVPPY